MFSVRLQHNPPTRISIVATHGLCGVALIETSDYRLDHRPGSPARCWGKKSSAEREALGRSRGGFTTKIHVRCEGKGKLITFLLTPGQESDIAQAEKLMQSGAVQGCRGRPRLLPKRLVADKGYTSQAFRS